MYKASLRRNAMKIELKSREGSAYKKLCSSIAGADCDAELIIPDTLEDVLRILCCRHQCRIKEKNISQDSVRVSGEIDATIIYVPETGEGVRTVGTVIPFEVGFDAPGADSTSVSVTKLISVNVDAKAANPRKISVNASVLMEQSSYKYSDVRWAEPPAEAYDKLFFKTAELKYKSIVLVSEKTLSIEDELELPEPISGGDFVKAFCSIKPGSSEVVGTKLIVKAAADIEAIYLVSGVPQSAKFTLPFSQIFALPDGCTEPEVSVFSMITGQYFEPFDNKLSADIRAAIQVVCLREQSITYVCDAYSCRKQLDITKGEFDCLTETRDVTSSRSVMLSYNTDYGVDAVVSAAVCTCAPEISEDEAIVPVTADVIYKDREGALRSCRIRGKTQFELENGRHPDEVCVLNAEINASSGGDNVNADICVLITMRYLGYGSVSMISEVNETELDRDKSDIALYMCRCTDGDVWSLAKKYGSDTELIKLINEIDGAPDDRLLLIPVI